MARTYLLVDFENVQPLTLGSHVPPESEESFVKVFAGAQQNKVDLSLAQALQLFGSRAEYIQIAGTGKDALDFHIAYYIGRLAAEHPSSTFIILSKDAGFDPLIKHLAQHHIACKRVRSMDGKAPAAKARPGKAAAKLPMKTVAKAKAKAKVPQKVTVTVLSESQGTPQRTAPKDASSVPVELQVPVDRVKEIVQRLAGLKAAQPRTVKTLRSSVMSWFKPALSAAQMDAVVQQLQSQGLLKISGNKALYTFPSRQK
jgi:hypothetical protein